MILTHQHTLLLTTMESTSKPHPRILKVEESVLTYLADLQSYILAKTRHLSKNMSSSHNPPSAQSNTASAHNRT
jgi:hypothetical protein